jgi:hypothetical protein
MLSLHAWGRSDYHDSLAPTRNFRFGLACTAIYGIEETHRSRYPERAKRTVELGDLTCGLVFVVADCRSIQPDFDPTASFAGPSYFGSTE